MLLKKKNVYSVTDKLYSACTDTSNSKGLCEIKPLQGIGSKKFVENTIHVKDEIACCQKWNRCELLLVFLVFLHNSCFWCCWCFGELPLSVFGVVGVFGVTFDLDFFSSFSCKSHELSFPH